MSMWTKFARDYGWFCASVNEWQWRVIIIYHFSLGCAFNYVGTNHTSWMKCLLYVLCVHKQVVGSALYWKINWLRAMTPVRGEWVMSYDGGSKQQDIHPLELIMGHKGSAYEWKVFCKGRKAQGSCWKCTLLGRAIDYGLQHWWEESRWWAMETVTTRYLSTWVVYGT